MIFMTQLDNTKLKTFGAYLPTESEFNRLERYAKIIYKSKAYASKIQGDDMESWISKIMTVLLKAYELNIPPQWALSEIGFISSTPVMSAKLMLGLIYRDVPKSQIIYEELSSKQCVLHARRDPSQKFTRFSYSFQLAKDAGLVNRPGSMWPKYPTQMIKWRTVANMARTLFPDVIMGCYTPSEIEQIKNDSTFSNVQESLTDENELVQKIPILETIDEDFISDEEFSEAKEIEGLNEFEDMLGPEEIFQKAITIDEDDLTVDLVLDSPKVEKKKEISSPLSLIPPKISPKQPQKEKKEKGEIKKTISLKPITPLKKKTENKKEVKPSISIGGLKLNEKKTPKKPTLASTMDKIKKINLPKTIPKKENKPLKSGLNLSLSPKKIENEELSVESIKKYYEPDIYGSSPNPGDIGNDVPWNILHKILVTKLNTDERDVVNADIGKYFKQYASEIAPNETIAGLLLEAYIQYCEVDLQSNPPFDLEKELHEEMAKLISKILSYLHQNNNEIEKDLFLKQIIKNVGLKPNNKEWIHWFLESRGLIEENDGKVRPIFL